MKKTLALNKSDFVEFCFCPRKSWLKAFTNVKEEAPIVASTRGEEGTRIGEIARGYFGKENIYPNKIEVITTIKKFDTKYSYCEMPFLLDDKLYCACDIVRVNEDGSLDIYEVKGVNDYLKNKDKPENGINNQYLYDVSFQYYVISNIGFKINSINLMVFNKNYVYDGKSMPLNELFKVVDVTSQAVDTQNFVKEKIEAFFSMTKENEIKCPLKGYCKDYDGCGYLNHCLKSKGLPEKESIYDLYDYSTRYGLIEKGILKWEQLLTSENWDNLSEFNKHLILMNKFNINAPYVNHKELRALLREYKTPLYFFDFETSQETIPVYANSRPYQQIPFQYSLHVMKTKNCDLDEVKKKQKAFLGDGKNDPREDLIKQMLVDLGTSGSIVAYNANFEVTRIKELARDFPQYADELNALIERFVDLEIPFHDLVYIKGMDSCSIKHVLPAFFPNDPELNYHNLEDVHNGGEATESYKKLRTLKAGEAKKLRENMLKYCCLDTWAMVKLFTKINELSKEK